MESVTREPVYYIVLLQVRLKWANCGNIAPVAICGIVFIAVPLEIYLLCIMIVLHHSQQSTCWSGENEAKRLNLIFRWLRREQPFLLNSISALVLPPPSSAAFPTFSTLLPSSNPWPDGFRWSLTMIWFQNQTFIRGNCVLLDIELCMRVSVLCASLSQCVYSECKTLELHLFR